MIGLLAVALGLAAGATPALAQQACPSHLPLYTLTPPGWSCPVGPPTCGTDYGSCAYPLVVPGVERDVYVNVVAGLPCQCQAANGAWIPGRIIRGLEPPPRR